MLTQSKSLTSNINVSLNDIIIDLIKVLSSQNTFGSYFKTDIEVFLRITENFELGQIRVGLIGVTSSGKSALINVFLGEKLLPQKVKPSSNIIVVCGYSNVKKATIFFEEETNKPPEEILTNIGKAIEKYGDENCNPNNAQRVKEIHIGTPNFKLPNSISLIDSPGLDAYGMSSHDKITLQLALPTLDFILYVTTVKASSDQENLCRIDEISVDGKPLIIVQNMIDSIEPKIVKGGIIAKDKNQIKKEHYLRLKKLLSKGEKTSTINAEIIQLSALQALNNKDDESNINQLYALINEVEGKLKISQGYDRGKQLLKKVEAILENLSNVASYDFQQEEYNLQNLKITFTKTLEFQTFDATIIIKDFQNFKNSIVDKINYNIPESEIKRLLSSLSEMKVSIETALSSSILKTQTVIISMGNKLNITSKDLRVLITANTSHSDISISKTDTFTSVLKIKEKDGFYGSAARIFGKMLSNDNWGYENKKEQIKQTVIDNSTIVRDINSVYLNWEKWYLDAVRSYNEQTKKVTKKINDDINLKLKSIADKKKNIILTSDKEELRLNLRRIANQIKERLSASNNRVNIDNKEYKEVSTIQNIVRELTMTVNIFTLAQVNSYYPLYSIRNFCLEKYNSKSALIWGWDNNDLLLFTSLFFQCQAELNMNGNFSTKLLTDIGTVNVVNENNFNQNEHNVSFLQIAALKLTIFINVDLSQSGFAEKKYKESILNKINNKEVIWVIQGLDILLKNDSLVEAVVNFSNFLNNDSCLTKLFIVSNKNPFYSLLVYELINIKDVRNFLIADEKAIINRIGLGREDEVIRYVKQYLLEKRN